MVSAKGDPKAPRRIIELDLESGDTRDVFRGPEKHTMGLGELSPDGRYIATVAWNQAGKTSMVQLIPVDGGETRELFRVNPPEYLVRMSWTPDSQAVIVMKGTSEGDRGLREEDPKELWLVPVSKGQARKLNIDVKTWTLGVASIRLHPNGRQIAFFAGDSAREIWALENLLPALSAKN